MATTIASVRALLRFASVAVLLAASVVSAQATSQTNYLRFLPPFEPRRVKATQASVDFSLFGDARVADYQDENPRNGIDDKRDELFQALAVRFAPFLVQNTAMVPMDWKRYLQTSSSFPLFVDMWDFATNPVTRRRAERIDFNALGDEPCTGGVTLSDDCSLLRLLESELAGVPADPRVISPERMPFNVMYFDFPGSDEASWKSELLDLKQGLQDKYRGAEKTYVHPFVAKDGRGGFELVLQYWFFYPYNDSANNHEGDWEHLNVVVSPRSKVTKKLGRADIEEMLSRGADALGGADPLVSRRIDYVFHQNVFVMDQSKPNAYAPREQWEKEIEARAKEHFGAEAMFREIRRRTYRDADEKELNTHPIGFIGGESKGAELLIRSPGSKDRDSHGTFPFRGLFRDVGPALASEAINRPFDLDLLASKAEDPLPDYVVRFDRPDRIEILPDEERLAPLALSDADVRREWGWFLLPLRWGYPASESPFAGIIGGADTGNLAPVGPLFNAGWNHVGPGPSFADYSPHQLSSVIPGAALDTAYNSLGSLNIPVLLLVNLPPLDTVVKLGGVPIRAMSSNAFPPIHQPSQVSSVRVLGIGAGVSSQVFPGDTWSALFLNDRQSSSITQLVSQRVGDVVSTESTDRPAVAPYVSLSYFLSRKFATNTTVRFGQNDLGLNLIGENGSAANLQGTLQIWDINGSIRYSLLTSRVQPYLKAGYGWSFYRLTNVRIDGTRLDVPNSGWFRSPMLRRPSTWLPNSLHAGAGLEFAFVYSQEPLKPSVSLRLDYTLLGHSLGTSIDTGPVGAVRNPVVFRHELGIALVVSL